MVKNNTKTKVSIIILTISGPKMVKEALSDISKLKKDNIEVTCIVVDGDLTRNTEEHLKDYKIKGFNFKYIRTNENLGFAGGNNVGIKYALKKGADYILTLNDDIIVPSNLLEKLVEFMEDNPKVGIVSPKIYFAKEYEFHKDRYSKSDLGKVIWYAGGIIDWDNIYTSHRGVDEVDHGQYNKTVGTDLANGACMLVRSEVFKKIGLLDESLFLYWEDADFSKRAINNGFDVLYYPDVAVWHKVSASAGGSGSISNDYFLIRNRYYYAMRYAGTRAKFAVFRDTIKLALFGREWQKIGASDALLGKKGIGSWRK